MFKQLVSISTAEIHIHYAVHEGQTETCMHAPGGGGDENNYGHVGCAWNDQWPT